jgi:hypothetical protein
MDFSGFDTAGEGDFFWCHSAIVEHDRSPGGLDGGKEGGDISPQLACAGDGGKTEELDEFHGVEDGFARLSAMTATITAFAFLLVVMAGF